MTNLTNISIQNSQPPVSSRVETRADGTKVLVEERVQEQEMSTQEATSTKETRPPFITITDKTKFKLIQRAFGNQDKDINIMGSNRSKRGNKNLPRDSQRLQGSTKSN